MPLLKGGDIAIRENAVSASAQGIPALRSGSWKYILASDSRSGDVSPQSVHLYNLAEDIGETKNLAEALPEKVKEMKVLLDTIISEGRSTPGASQQNDVKVTRHPTP
jgi:arylsulfatase A